MVYGTQNKQEQKNSVCFEVNRKTFPTLVKIINALMNWLENTFKMCRLLTILRLESFVETSVRDLENELF